MSLAAAFGWTEAEVNATAWYNVPRYLAMAEKQKAAKMLDLLTMNRQAVNTDQDSLDAYVSALQEVINGPLDPRLALARQERQWARAAALGGDPSGVKELIKHAEYLEFCYRINREP